MAVGGESRKRRVTKAAAKAGVKRATNRNTKPTTTKPTKPTTNPVRRKTPRNAVARIEQARLVHDVEVHELELELQNRSLRESHDLVEESRARYAELYDGAPTGHVTLDARGTIREINLAAAALFGRQRGYLENIPLRSLLPYPSRRAFDSHLRACFKHRRTATVEIAMSPSAEVAEPRVLELVSVARPRSAGRGLAGADVVYSAVHDISERKREQARREELLRREQEARLLAEGANRFKEEFLAIVSHELRAPLAPMMLWLKALRAGGAGDALRARALDALDTCLKVQASMIDDLVDVARGRHGKLRIEREPMNLQDIVGAAIEALAPSGAEKHIQIALDVQAEPAWVSGDATRLQQVVGNLLSNAIKFTREGGHVNVSLRADGQEVVLRVLDDGDGIPGDVLPTVFEPFRQFDGRPGGRHGGLGLGLSIVKQLVTQHEGRVVAESAGRGRGAAFTVTLPRVPMA
ncbi:MAG: uncharacterized protein JWM82_795 [Myxococcales bacterium]|nr:uncharacterized protein [Myxococcales bacterium]